MTILSSTECQNIGILLAYWKNQLAISQVADWSSHRLVNSPTAIFLNHENTTLYLYTKPNPNPKSIDCGNCLIE